MMNKWRSVLDSLLILWILFIAWILIYVWEVLGRFMPLWGYMTYALVWGVLLRQLLSDSRYPGRRVVFGLFLVVLVCQSVLFSSRRGFLRHLYSVRPGMTVTQVEDIMGRYHEFDGEESNVGHGSDGKLKLVSGNGLSYRHADGNNGLFNADVGVVIFKNGRVEEVSFDPD